MEDDNSHLCDIGVCGTVVKLIFLRLRKEVYNEILLNHFLSAFKTHLNVMTVASTMASAWVCLMQKLDREQNEHRKITSIFTSEK